ncbi:unnamed protein product [Amoebophrya sp. A25]|nr:unnamed protein product [Amoebophrya sp. A25]|eukprot:GSA25T00022726001.1
MQLDAYVREIAAQQKTLAGTHWGIDHATGLAEAAIARKPGLSEEDLCRRHEELREATLRMEAEELASASSEVKTLERRIAELTKQTHDLSKQRDQWELRRKIVLGGIEPVVEQGRVLEEPVVEKGSGPPGEQTAAESQKFFGEGTHTKDPIANFKKKLGDGGDPSSSSSDRGSGIFSSSSGMAANKVDNAIEVDTDFEAMSVDLENLTWHGQEGDGQEGDGDETKQRKNEDQYAQGIKVERKHADLLAEKIHEQVVGLQEQRENADVPAHAGLPALVDLPARADLPALVDSVRSMLDLVHTQLEAYKREGAEYMEYFKFKDWLVQLMERQIPLGRSWASSATRYHVRSRRSRC